MQKKDISIVIPVYNEQDSLTQLYKELKEVLSSLNKTYEIIFVDDGSNDKSFHFLSVITLQDQKVKVIKFRKNYGKSEALSAGFGEAIGDIIITLDADLQDPPKEIPKFIDKINEGYDLVSGWKHHRKDPLTKKVPSKFFNFLSRLLTRVKIHDINCGFKAYKKNVVNNLKLYGDLHRFIPSILSWKGYKIGEIKVNHRPRKYGKSKYGFNRLIKGFLDLIMIKFWMDYSTRPMHLCGGIGILTSFIGFLIGVILLIEKLFFGELLSGRPLLLLSILLIPLGLQFIIFGFLADIMIRIYYSKDNKHQYNIELIKGGEQ